jgi:TolB-like protein/Tfp pilus assembly protein PilF
LAFFQELKRRNTFRVAIAYLALAWLMTEVAGTLFPGFGVPEWAFRFVVIVLVLGFVPVLIFSWVFEMTPEGLKRERDLDRDAATTQRAARRLDYLTMALIVVALGFIAVDRLWLGTRAPAAAHSVSVSPADPAPTAMQDAETIRDSIAVLPFANRSANPDDAFFVDGIHDDLLTYISQIGSIKTISRTSVMQYRDSTLSIPEIGGELGVATILEGGVQRSGDQVRINVQLIDARTDDHLWSSIYDRQLTAANVFAIQSEIAQSIAEALRATLTSAEQKRLVSVPTENLEALEAYFLGKQNFAVRRSPELAKAAEYFEQAVALDPEFALAWVGVADTWFLHFRGLSREGALAESRRAAETALRLNPFLGEAYAADAKRKHWEGDLEGSEASFKRAIELAPNYAPAYHWYAQMVEGHPGRIEETLALYRQAIKLDPQSAVILADSAGGLVRARRYDEALANLRKSLEIEPRFVRAYWGMWNIHGFYLGQIDEALASARGGLAAFSEDPGDFGEVGALYLTLGAVDEARTWAQLAQSVGTGTIQPVSCQLHSHAGETEQAANCARKLLVTNDQSVWGLMLVRDHLAAQDELAAARSLFERTMPNLFEDPLKITHWTQKQVAFEVAHLLMNTGSQAEAERLLKQALAYDRSDPSTPAGELAYQEAFAHAVRGNKERMINSLQQAVQKGWRIHAWYLGRHPAFEPFLEMDEFQKLQDDIESDLAAQRARVQQWESLGELPPMPNP